MKVESSRGARPAGNARSAKRGSGPAGGFADEMKVAAGSGGAEDVAAAAPAGAVDALLAVQEAGDATSGGGNARARAWGGEVLDRLEEIRVGLLTGTIPLQQLESLTRLVERQRESGVSPHLAAVLDEIELRAKVELAKLARSR